MKIKEVIRKIKAPAELAGASYKRKKGKWRESIDKQKKERNV